MYKKVQSKLYFFHIVCVPIHKKGDKNVCEIYRGISILSCLGKLFTSVLNRRLNQWAEKNGVFNNFQFGFRSERSTVDFLFILNSALQKCLKDGDRLYCSFVDLKRAFDGTNRRAMWFKLSQSNISCKMITVIKSMYEKMKMKVFILSVYFLCHSLAHIPGLI